MYQIVEVCFPNLFLINSQQTNLIESPWSFFMD
jgi:hypothetical protein